MRTAEDMYVQFIEDLLDHMHQAGFDTPTFSYITENTDEGMVLRLLFRVVGGMPLDGIKLILNECENWAFDGILHNQRGTTTITVWPIPDREPDVVTYMGTPYPRSTK